MSSPLFVRHSLTDGRFVLIGGQHFARVCLEYRKHPKSPFVDSPIGSLPVWLTRAKWATMILKLGMDDYPQAIIPMAQRGFVPGRSMGAHLHEVREIQPEGKTGCSIAMDFRKAFDTVSHPMLEAYSGSQSSCPSSRAP